MKEIDAHSLQILLNGALVKISYSECQAICTTSRFRTRGYLWERVAESRATRQWRGLSSKLPVGYPLANGKSMKWYRGTLRPNLLFLLPSSLVIIITVTTMVFIITIIIFFISFISPLNSLLTNTEQTINWKLLLGQALLCSNQRRIYWSLWFLSFSVKSLFEECPLDIVFIILYSLLFFFFIFIYLLER